ncbi:MAG: DNA polymerase III subunit gamma/tau [Phycisphaerales bacterium JB037]
MAYTVLARRYRSRDFAELVGQEPIARTLQSAIDAGRVAHAYLFTGTRGVGKTSTARIFANALNNPDNNPAIANAIMTGGDTDVIEIDGASNRGIDDARDLIANALYRPMRGRYKIYIIDEVHALTKDAFNALLKIMEEPPEHVVFILCTTEPHKVLPTIQSRCQRFDFRAISTAAIADHLARIIKEEGLKAADEVLHAVARLGNGSMRDALSILDRLMATGEKTLTLSLLESLLGLPEREQVSSILDAIADAAPKPALLAADTLLRNGASPEQLLEALAARLRDLLLLRACGDDTELVELTGPVRTEETARARRFDEPALVHTIALCESVQRALRTSAIPRALLDALLVRLCLTERIADATALLAGATPTATNASRGVASAGGTTAKKA